MEFYKIPTDQYDGYTLVFACVAELSD